MAQEIITQAMQPVQHSLSVWSLFAQADMVVKLVILMLIASSIYSWSVIFDKFIKFKVLKLNIANFEKHFWSGTLLSKLYQKVKDNVNNPLAAVFVAAMHEWEHANEKNLLRSDQLQVNFKQRIIQAMQVAGTRELEKCEKNISHLATIGSVAPFIGLFGTVWGIMSSFQAIASNQNTSLAIVAPGIAEALLTTAIGLFAAVPAVIFYNIMAGRMNILVAKVDNFTNELYSLISRQLDKEE